VIGPDGRILAEQPKMVPLPFFEDGEPGRRQEVIRTPQGPMGTYICYDGLFTDMPRRVVEAGAEILLVPNLDDPAWPVQLRWHHAAMAPVRSIELRRCAVRANGAGITQIIDATGRAVGFRTDCGDGLVLGNVYRVGDQTFFSRAGHWLAPGVAMSFVVMVIWLTFTKPAARRT
jgi:apolipoprotein N-acyltransferase